MRFILALCCSCYLRENMVQNDTKQFQIVFFSSFSFLKTKCSFVYIEENKERQRHIERSK